MRFSLLVSMVGLAAALGCSEVEMVGSPMSGGPTSGGSAPGGAPIAALESDEILARGGLVLGGGANMARCVDGSGRTFVFHTDRALLPEQDTNGTFDIYARDLNTGAVRLISQNAAGMAAGGRSSFASISQDGEHVVFLSEAPDLVADDTNGSSDVFLWSRDSGIRRLSLDTQGRQVSGTFNWPVINRDGQVVAFTSTVDLENGGTPFANPQVYRWEASGPRRISSAPGGEPADGFCNQPEISGDGEHVVFISQATNLRPGARRTFNVYVYDHQVGLQLITPGARDICVLPGIDDSGQRISFESRANNLVPNDVGSTRNLFVFDRETQTLSCVDTLPDGRPSRGSTSLSSLSRDGRRIVFSSGAPDLVPDDGNGVDDVFMHTVGEPGSTRRLSQSSDFPAVDGNQASNYAAWAGDSQGNVVFRSLATNLDWARPNGDTADVFLWKAQAGTVGQVKDAVGFGIENLSLGRTSDSLNASVSADGRFVVFDTMAPLVPGDTARRDVYLMDRAAPPGSQFTRLSWSTTGGNPNGNSNAAEISADGRYVVFLSGASNLVPGDTNGKVDVFRYDRLTRRIQMVSTRDDGTFSTQARTSAARPSISGDGQRITFQSGANDFSPVPGTQTQVYLKTVVGDAALAAGPLVRVSQRPGNSSTGRGNSANARLSQDGRFVVFDSSANDLDPADTSGRDIYLYSVEEGTLRYVSLRANGAGRADRTHRVPAISADGRYVAFESSSSNIVTSPAKTGAAARYDIIVRDLVLGTNMRASVASDGTQANENCLNPRLSADGRVLVFQTSSSALVGPTGGGPSRVQIVARSRQASFEDGFTPQGLTAVVSRAADGQPGAVNSELPFVSADGRFVLFQSAANNLVSGDNNGQVDIFVTDTVF